MSTRSSYMLCIILTTIAFPGCQKWKDWRLEKKYGLEDYEEVEILREHAVTGDMAFDEWHNFPFCGEHETPYIINSDSMLLNLCSCSRQHNLFREDSLFCMPRLVDFNSETILHYSVSAQVSRVVKTERRVYINDNQKRVKYIINTKVVENEELAASYPIDNWWDGNMVIIPKIPDDYTLEVIPEIKYK